MRDSIAKERKAVRVVMGLGWAGLGRKVNVDGRKNAKRMMD